MPDLQVHRAGDCRPRIPVFVPPAAGIVQVIAASADADAANAASSQILCSALPDAAIAAALSSPFYAMTTRNGACVYERRDGTVKLTIQIGLGAITAWCNHKPASDMRITRFRVRTGLPTGCYETFLSRDVDTHRQLASGRWYRFGMDPDPTAPLIITASFDGYRKDADIGWVGAALPAPLFPRWDKLVVSLAAVLTRPA